jgi:hypothetical protein
MRTSICIIVSALACSCAPKPFPPAPPPLPEPPPTTYSSYEYPKKTGVVQATQVTDNLVDENVPTIEGCPVFNSESSWNRDISNEPVDPHSREYISYMRGGLHPDFGSSLQYGIPYNIVSKDSQIPFNILPLKFVYDDESDHGYPIPANIRFLKIEGTEYSDRLSTDRHVILIDKDKCMLYEIWRWMSYKDDKPCSANCDQSGSGAIFNLRYNLPRARGITSADAAGLAIFPGLVKYDEAKTEIKHALRFTMQKTSHAYVYPASHYAGTTRDPKAPPMGLRVRLKASYDISWFPPIPKAIATAMKKYGMVLADNGGNWYFSGVSDPRFNDQDLDLLKLIRSTDFEVIETGPITR